MLEILMTDTEIVGLHMPRVMPRPFVLLAAAIGVVLTGVSHGLSTRGLETELPRVRLIATGGTIATRTGGARLSAEELVQSVPDLRRYVRPEWEQFSNIASTALALDQWVRLARRIDDVLASESALRGIVVTTGTDTLEELAYFLHLTVRSPRPVVLTGSMRTPGAAGYDGQANLLSAFRTASDPKVQDKGVLVVMNDEINSARDVAKTDAQRLDAFQSRQHGALGIVDADRVLFFRDPLKRHTVRSEFDLHNIGDLPRVDILLFFQGATPDLVRASVDLGARGVVLAVAGADTTAGTLAEGLTYAAKHRVPVVLSTRTGRGRIASPTGDGAFAQYIAGEDLPPLKARILLALALTRTHSASEIQRIFREY
jgi:L-asparaginase